MATRPSLLNRAELCSLVPVLVEQHPESVPAGWHGTDHHVEIVRAWQADDEPITPEAKAAIDWLRTANDLAGCKVQMEQKLVLIDYTSLTTITEGTADVVITRPDGSVVVVDWKTGNPDNVREVDDNLQLIAYGLSAAAGQPFTCVLVFLDGLKADPQSGSTWQTSEHPALLERVKAASLREPSASVGDWCPDCYARKYCDAYKATLSLGMAVLPTGAVTTDADANKLATMVAMVDGDKGWLAAAKLALKEHVRSGGTVIRNGKRMAIAQAKGRESADVQALHEAGLEQYIKQGAPYETTKWLKV